MRNTALHARFGVATATRGTVVEPSEGDDKDEFVTPSKRSADDRKGTDHAVQSNLEFETPVKGPKQVPKLLPRPAGARPGVQKPPTTEAELPMKEVIGGKVEEVPVTSDPHGCRQCRNALRSPALFAGWFCQSCGIRPVPWAAAPLHGDHAV